MQAAGVRLGTPASVRGIMVQRKMPGGTRFSPHLKRYGGALLCTAARVALKALIHGFVGDRIPYASVYVALLVSARFFGVGPAVMCAVLGALGAWKVGSGPDPVTAVPFVISSSLTIWIIEVLRRANDRAEES